MGAPTREKSMGRIHSIFLGLAAAMLLLSPASGMAQRWAVVRAGVGDPTEAERAARTQLIDALNGTGVTVRVDADAAARVEDYHSVEPSAVESDRIEELRAAVTALEEHAALRHRDAARREAERIRELSEGLSSALAEQSEVAERLFAACIAEAWLHVQLREREEARQILQQCRELHPDSAINPLTVAPPVVEMLREIDAELARRPTFALTLSGVPSGCELRMDGRRRATAPEPIAGIVPGEHRIEVVCEGLRRRRIHRVIVGAENRTLPLDVRFDDVLRTRPNALGESPEVRLDYVSESDERDQRVTDALTLAGLLEASDVVLVSRESRGLRFDRVEVSARAVRASVIVDPATFAGATVLRAATALLENESVDLTGPSPVAIRAWPAGASAAVAGGGGSVGGGGASGGASDAAPIAGVILALTGAAAIGVAWGTYSIAADAGGAMAGSSPSNPDWIANRGTRSSVIGASFGLSIGGAALATASLPLWLPQTPGEVPWWSVVIGVAGIGAMIPAFIYLPADGILRDERTPYLRYDTELYGTMWLAMGTPLLAVPVVYLIRLLTDPAVAASASLDVTPEHAVLSVSGRF